MLKSKTVLVVGAGASCEANFPDGQQLLRTIRGLLDIRFEMGNRQVSGDHVIANALLDLLPERRYSDEYNAYLHSARRIRDAATIGLSIDNIIEQHDDDQRVAICGKLAILRAILQAEKKSLLMPRAGRPDEVDISKVADTWYGRLGQIITENVPRRKAEEVFQNLEIICFNYDRALEHFLPYSLVTAWGLELREARALVSELKILHPYGRVSALPWEAPNAGVEYGGEDRAPYARLVEQIRTFSERIEDEDALADIRGTMASAEQIIFLGFAFHAPNMELIAPGKPTQQRALATVFRLPDNEKRQIENQLRSMLNLAEGIDGLVLHDGTCADLFRENWRTISA